MILPAPLPVREVARQRLEKVMKNAEEVAARAGVDVGIEEDGGINTSPATREQGGGEERRQREARRCRAGLGGRSKRVVDMGAVFF